MPCCLINRQIEWLPFELACVEMCVDFSVLACRTTSTAAATLQQPTWTRLALTEAKRCAQGRAWRGDDAVQRQQHWWFARPTASC